MKKLLILVCLLGLAFASQDFDWADETTWVVVVEYNNGEVNIIEQKQVQGPPPNFAFNQGANYSYVTYSGNGQEIAKRSFDFPLVTLYDYPETELFDEEGNQKMIPQGEEAMVMQNYSVMELVLPEDQVGSTIELKDSEGQTLVEKPMVESKTSSSNNTGNGNSVTPKTPPKTGNVTGNQSQVDNGTGRDDGGGSLDWALLVGVFGLLLVGVIVLVVVLVGSFIVIKLFKKKPSKKQKNKRK
jgi:hypothetical protein